MKNRFVIALDFDGVVTDPYKLKTFYLNEKGYNLSEEQSSALSCINKGITKEDYEYATKKAFTSSPEILPLVPDFIEVFKRIKKLNQIKIFIITSRENDLLDHLKNFLGYHQIKVDGIINTNKKNKINDLIKIGARVFIDDSPFNFFQMLNGKKELKIKWILFRNIQNKLEKKPSKEIVEVGGWKELEKILFKEYEQFLESEKDDSK